MSYKHNEEERLIPSNIDSKHYGNEQQARPQIQMQIHADSSGHGYQDLSSKEVCVARPSQVQEVGLVARWGTRKIVVTTIIICMVAVGILLGILLCVFLIPRSGEFAYLDSDTLSTNIDISTSLNITFLNSYNVSNPNFVPLKLTKISTHVVCPSSDNVVNSNDVDINKVSFPLKSVETLRIYVDVSVTNADFHLDNCCSPNSPTHIIILEFTTTIHYQVMNKYSQSNVKHVQHFNCTMPHTYICL